MDLKTDSISFDPIGEPCAITSGFREKSAQSFQQFGNVSQYAASMARIAAGVDVLVARVTVADEVLTVRSDQVGQAMATLHGTPLPGMAVAAQVEYLAMSAADFAALPDWQ